SKTLFKAIKISRQSLFYMIRIVNHMHTYTRTIFYRNRNFLMLVFFDSIHPVINHSATRKIHFIFFSLGQERIKPFLSFLSCLYKFAREFILKRMYIEQIFFIYFRLIRTSFIFIHLTAP